MDCCTVDQVLLVYKLKEIYRLQVTAIMCTQHEHLAYIGNIYTLLLYIKTYCLCTRIGTAD